MEKAKWNGNEYIATEVADCYDLVKKIKIASENKEIFCIDPECSSPILRYCNGPQKRAYFAHLDNSNCDYAKFDKKNTKIMRCVKRMIFKSFNEKGFNVDMEVKVLPKHYSHLLFTLWNGKRIVLELGTPRTSAKTIDSLSKEYAKIGIECKWLVISNFDKL